MVAPVFLTLPTLAFAAASGLSNDAGSVRLAHRDAACAAGGLSGVQDPPAGPTLLVRLAMCIGRKAARAFETRAKADLASGVWGAAPVNVRYQVQGEHVTPVTGPTPDAGPVTKILIKADGETLVTSTVDEKLHAQCGRPSTARVDLDGHLAAAAWHVRGKAQSVWQAGSPVELTIGAGMLAGEIWILANEIRYEPGHEAIADALDKLYEHALRPSSNGYAAVEVSFDITGAVDIDALNHHLGLSVIAAAEEAPGSRR